MISVITVLQYLPWVVRRALTSNRQQESLSDNENESSETGDLQNAPPIIELPTVSPETSRCAAEKTTIITNGDTTNTVNNNIPQFIFNNPPRLPIINNIPAIVTPFAGRDEKLSEITKLLNEGNMVAVCGLAGIGKSELVRQYAHKNRENYLYMVWVEAGSERSLNQCFRDLARDLGRNYDKDTDMKRNVGNVYNSLYVDGKTSFVVFDNALYRQAINAYLPGNRAGLHVVITSQTTQWEDGVYPLELKPLEGEAAIQVFRGVLRGVINVDENIELFTILANELSNMPLALQLAACYLRQEANDFDPNFSVADYVVRLQKGDTSILEVMFPKGSANAYQKSIYKAMKITLDRIRKTEKNGDTLSDLAYGCSYLDADKILDFEVKLLIKRHTQVEKLQSFLRVLKMYFLLSVETRIIDEDSQQQFRRIRMHRLVQRVVRFHQYQQNVADEHLSAAIQLTFEYRNHLSSVSQYAVQHLDDIHKDGKKSTIKKQGETWLRWAAEKGHSQIVTFLVNDLKIDVNSQDCDGKSPLHQATCCKDEDRGIEYTCLFMEHGASGLVKDQDGKIPLHLAAMHGRLELMRLYLEKYKINPNAPDIIGNVSLHQVAFCNDEVLAQKCAQLLVQFDASVDAKNILNETPLHRAVQRGRLELVRLYIKEYAADINAQNADGRTALHLSVQWEDTDKAAECVQFLVQHSASIHCKDNEGKTPLDYAQTSNNTSLVQILIESKTAPP